MHFGERMKRGVAAVKDVPHENMIEARVCIGQRLPRRRENRAFGSNVQLSKPSAIGRAQREHARTEREERIPHELPIAFDDDRVLVGCSFACHHAAAGSSSELIVPGAGSFQRSLKRR